MSLLAHWINPLPVQGSSPRAGWLLLPPRPAAAWLPAGPRCCRVVTHRHTGKPTRPAAAHEHRARAQLRFRGAFLWAAQRGGTEPPGEVDGSGAEISLLAILLASSPAIPPGDPLREQDARAAGQSP